VRSKPKGAYALSGVDIDTADTAKGLIKKLARSTYRPEVLTDIGLFGGLFQFKGYRDPVLVSSVDGVGTKLKLASTLEKYNTVGVDLVNHCVNDILCCGAEPLFFLDYIAMGKLIPQKVEKIVEGLAQACRLSGCALIGGETAEMPGIYQGDDFDLVGSIVGAVEKENILPRPGISKGDVLIGLPSSGLHTNGYSLVRSIFDLYRSPTKLRVCYPELGRSLGEGLLEPHRCYYPELKSLLPLIKGLAHITGGGIPGNLPRILPDALGARINKDSWTVPPIFQFIQKQGKVEESEMFKVFNMGIGMIVLCSPQHSEKIIMSFPESVVIGQVTPANKKSRITIE
jgi:phosphoribosylformylglycinamidine cyclo-ligase